MAVENDQVTYTFVAGEDLSANGAQYKAIALDDGKYAANGKEACGILKNKPESGQHGTLCISGVCKYVAGGAVAAGARLTVAGSGFLTSASSGYYTVGRNGRIAVTSGSVGTGIFHFAGVYLTTSYE